MPRFNLDILKRNIKKLLKNKNITQQQFADKIGMSQSNVSKALNEEDKKCFTLEQICSIAECLGVSIDWLLGHEASQKIPTSQRAIGTLLAELLSRGDAKCSTIQVHEPVYVLDYDTRNGYPEYTHSEQDNPYLAIYFPNYWDPDELAKNDDEFEELYAEAKQLGNDTANVPVNIFLKKFVDILNVYKDKQISEEVYQIVLKDYLNQLREK